MSTEKKSLEQRVINKFASPLILTLAIWGGGCNLTGSDFLGVALNEGAKNAKTAKQARSARALGELARRNAEREHQRKTAREGATEVHVHTNDNRERSERKKKTKKKQIDKESLGDYKSISEDYNPIFDPYVNTVFGPDKEKMFFTKLIYDKEKIKNEEINLEIFMADRRGKNIERLTYSKNKIEYIPKCSEDGGKLAYLYGYCKKEGSFVSVLDLNTHKKLDLSYRGRDIYKNGKKLELDTENSKEDKELEEKIVKHIDSMIEKEINKKLKSYSEGIERNLGGVLKTLEYSFGELISNYQKIEWIDNNAFTISRESSNYEIKRRYRIKEK